MSERSGDRPALEPATVEPLTGPLAPLVRIRPLRALQFREYRYLWLGQATTAMSTWMDQVARGWLIYELTDSALQLGLIRVVQALPFLLLSPIAGVLADRYDRKAQIVAAQLVDGVLYGLLAVLIFSRLIEPWHVYVTALAAAVVQVFQQPPRQALVSESVPGTYLVNAIGLNSVVFNLCRSIGPAIAGVLIAVVGTGAPFAVQSGLYALATVWTLQLRVTGAPRGARGAGRLSARFVMTSTVEGWRFVRQNEAVRIAIIIVMIASLLAIPFTTLLPVFARDILHAGPTGQGLLLTAMGIGALCSAIVVASAGDLLPRGAIMLGGVTCYGLAITAFGASSQFELSFLLMIAVGLFHVSSHALIQTVVQTHAPPELRGRAMAVFQQNVVLMTVGGLLAGTLASLWSAPWAVGSMGLLCSLSMVALALAAPGARLIR